MITITGKRLPFVVNDDAIVIGACRHDDGVQFVMFHAGAPHRISAGCNLTLDQWRTLVTSVEAQFAAPTGAT